MPVPKSWGFQQAFSSSQHENFKSAWPSNDHQQQWHSWGLPSKSHGRETWDTPTLEEEVALLGKEIKPPPVPGSPPEPAKWSITPRGSSPSPSPQPSCLTSRKAKKSQQEMKANPDSTGRWVSLYVQENKRVPEWWREFWSLLCSKEKCVSNIKAQRLAQQQATAFRLPAAQIKKNGLWTAPSCLGVLACWDYLPAKDFKGTQDYQVVQHEEMVELAMALQRHTVHSWTSPGMLCGAVQELCRVEWRPGWPWNVGCSWEGPHGPCLYRESSVANSWGRTTG